MALGCEYLVDDLIKPLVTREGNYTETTYPRLKARPSFRDVLQPVDRALFSGL